MMTYKDAGDLISRLEQLEHFFSGKVKNPIYDAIELHIEKFHERIKSIETLVEKIEDMQIAMTTMPNVVWAKYQKTPHKCPVCDGQGKLWPIGTIGYDRCDPCEGKGIVWG